MSLGPKDNSRIEAFGKLETASGVMVQIDHVNVQLYNPKSVDATKRTINAQGANEASFRVIVPEGSQGLVEQILKPHGMWESNGTSNAWLDADLIDRAVVVAPKTQAAQAILDAMKNTVRVMAKLEAGRPGGDTPGYIIKDAS